jgi:hypothetical protein
MGMAQQIFSEVCQMRLLASYSRENIVFMISDKFLSYEIII